MLSKIFYSGWQIQIRWYDFIVIETKLKSLLGTRVVLNIPLHGNIELSYRGILSDWSADGYLFSCDVGQPSVIFTISDVYTVDFNGSENIINLKKP
jgi:hypothetical protein